MKRLLILPLLLLACGAPAQKPARVRHHQSTPAVVGRPTVLPFYTLEGERPKYTLSVPIRTRGLPKLPRGSVLRLYAGQRATNSWRDAKEFQITEAIRKGGATVTFTVTTTERSGKVTAQIKVPGKDALALSSASYQVPAWIPSPGSGGYEPQIDVVKPPIPLNSPSDGVIAMATTRIAYGHPDAADVEFYYTSNANKPLPNNPRHSSPLDRQNLGQSLSYAIRGVPKKGYLWIRTKARRQGDDNSDLKPFHYDLP